MNEKFRTLLSALARTPRRLAILSFAVFFTLSASWAMASPMGSPPDDRAHLIKAAATARGELNGHFGYLLQAGTLEPARYFKVPSAYAKVDGVGTYAGACYSFKSEVPASCAAPITGDGGLVSLPTTAGHYNPVYYAAVGWPSLLSSGLLGMYLMRLMAALLCSLFLAAAVYLVAQWRRPTFALLGVAVAATPMALYVNGMVNPNGAEASSALLAWAAALSIAMDPRPELFKRRLILLAIAFSVLANARPLGAEWIFAIMATAFLVMRRGALTGVLRSRTTWVAAAVTGVFVLLGVGWSVTHGDNAKVPYTPAHSFSAAAHLTLNLTPAYIHEMIGNFGWLDTPVPTVTLDLWIGAILLLTIIGWACGRLRDNIALLGLLIGVIAIPILAQGVEAKHIGIVWQGRYLLAFAMGLPILAGAVLAERGTQIPAALQRRIAAIVLLLLAFANFAAFFHAMRRFSVGLGKALIPLPAHWAPPGTWLLWLALYAAAVVGLVLVMLAASLERDGEAPRPTPAPESNEASAITDGLRSASASRIGAA